jgi:hypothetical protein
VLTRAKIWGHDLQRTPSFDTVTELASCPLIFAGDAQQNTIQTDLQANQRPSFIIRIAKQIIEITGIKFKFVNSPNPVTW